MVKAFIFVQVFAGIQADNPRDCTVLRPGTRPCPPIRAGWLGVSMKAPGAIADGPPDWWIYQPPVYCTSVYRKKDVKVKVIDPPPLLRFRGMFLTEGNGLYSRI